LRQDIAWGNRRTAGGRKRYRANQGEQYGSPQPAIRADVAPLLIESMNCPPDRPQHQPTVLPAPQGHDRRRDRSDIELRLDISSSVILTLSRFHISYDATADAC
jgi:hypothetical protein